MIWETVAIYRGLLDYATICFTKDFFQILPIWRKEKLQKRQESLKVVPYQFLKDNFFYVFERFSWEKFRNTLTVGVNLDEFDVLT